MRGVINPHSCRPRRLLAVALLLAVSAGLPLWGADSASAAPPADAPRNIVFILADDLGWGSLGCYGANPAKVKTPNLDRLASQGIKIMDAYEPSSVCSPSRYGFITGRFFWRTTNNPEVLSEYAPFHPGLGKTTVASQLKQAGYFTGIIGKWHLGIGNEPALDWTQPLMPGPLEAGFDYFYGMAANCGNPPDLYIENHAIAGQAPGQKITFVTGKWHKTEATGATDPRTNIGAGPRFCDRAVKFIEDHKNTPFFLYYAPNEVHEPATPAPEFQGTSGAGPYGDFIQQLDAEVGRVLRKLDELNLSQNTLVIFSSDNGGVIVGGPRLLTTPEGQAQRLGFFANGPLRDGKHSVHEGGFRVPFIARWPGHIPAGATSTAIINVADMIATLSDLVHQPLPPDAGEDSFDILSVLLNQTTQTPGRDFTVMLSAMGNYAVRSGPWKYIEVRDDSKFPPEIVRHNFKTENAWQLYNLNNDLGEKLNLYLPTSPQVTTLQADLNQVRDHGRSRP